MEIKEKSQLICNQISKKGTLKQAVFKNTEEVFEMFKNRADDFPQTFHHCHPESNILVKYDNPQPQIGRASCRERV